MVTLEGVGDRCPHRSAQQRPPGGLGGGKNRRNGTRQRAPRPLHGAGTDTERDPAAPDGAGTDTERDPTAPMELVPTRSGTPRPLPPPPPHHALCGPSARGKL